RVGKGSVGKVAVRKFPSEMIGKVTMTGSACWERYKVVATVELIPSVGFFLFPSPKKYKYGVRDGVSRGDYPCVERVAKSPDTDNCLYVATLVSLKNLQTLRKRRWRATHATYQYRVLDSNLSCRRMDRLLKA
ncbi:unnamed protein product, partial [Caenorhabditis auriculariae]